MRTRWIGVAFAMALITCAGILALVISDQGSAGATPEFVPLARAEVTPALRGAINSVAREAAVDTTSIYEVAAVGVGKYRRSAFVGTDRSGALRVSLSAGFGLSPFMTESKLFQGGMIINVAEGFSGPSTEIRSVGLTGVAKSFVERVTIEQRNGDVLETPLAKGPTGDLRFFASFTDTREHFPVVVRAYDGSGVQVARYRSQAKALCSSAKPDCLG